jgi:HK97 family phage major capsid protein
MRVLEMQTELGKLVKRQRELNDLATPTGGETRDFTGDEQTEYDKIEKDVLVLEEDIKKQQKREADAAEREARLASLEKHLSAAPAPVVRPTPGAHRAAPADADARRSEDPYRRLLAGLPKHLHTDEYRDAFCLALAGDYDAANKRADTLQVGLLTKGGYLQPSVEFLAEILKNVDNDVFVRRYARKFPILKAESLGVPRLDTDIDDADWTSELLTGSQGDFVFGKRELRPHPMAKSVKVSKKLPQVSVMPIDQFVRERLQYKFGITDEKGFLTGDGAQKPLGVFTASANGISTARDVSTDNTATEITADGLQEAKGAMKASYWPQARWAFHRTGITKIRKLKDGNGQYLWVPGLNGGTPSMILDLPYDVSEYVPNTFTTGLYVGALCAWPYYWIVDALDMTVQFVDQLYAATNQDGYIARREVDGMPVLEEAFVRVKLA